MAKKAKLDLSLNNVITCAVYAIIGVLLLVFRSGLLGIAMTVAGVLLIVLGVLDIVNKKDLVKGLIEAVLGIAIIVCGWLIAEIVLLVLGVVLIIKGALEIFHNYKAGFRGLISPIVTVVVGIVLAVTPLFWTLIDIFCIIAGVIFLIDAVLALFGLSMSK